MHIPYTVYTVVVRRSQLYEEGMELFNNGELKASYDKFEKVLVAMPVKTRVRVLNRVLNPMPY